MTVPLYRWGIWTDGPARPGWTLDDGTRRLGDTVRRLRAAFPDEAATVDLDVGGPPLPVDNDIDAMLRPRLASSRDQQRYRLGDELGDAHVHVPGLGRGRLWVTWRQLRDSFRVVPSGGVSPRRYRPEHPTEEDN